MFSASLTFCSCTAGGWKLAQRPQRLRGWAADLHALNDMLPGQALVIGSLASPEDFGGNDVVRALPLQLLFGIAHQSQRSGTRFLAWTLAAAFTGSRTMFVVIFLQELTLMAWPIMVSALPEQQSISQASVHCT